MEKKEFKKTLKAILSDYGFEYKNKSYYLRNSEMLVIQ